MGACASPTRAVAFGGGAWQYWSNEVIEFVNIATTG